jgi:hypothetical protein
MMQKIRVFTWCDHPECQANNTFENLPEGQETKPIVVWVYSPGKGRKTNHIKVEVCEKHEAELKDLYKQLLKFDQGAE